MNLKEITEKVLRKSLSRTEVDIQRMMHPWKTDLRAMVAMLNGDKMSQPIHRHADCDDCNRARVMITKAAFEGVSFVRDATEVHRAH